MSASRIDWPAWIAIAMFIGSWLMVAAIGWGVWWVVS